MIRLQPKDMPDQDEENKKAHQNVVDNTVIFFLTIAVIRAGKFRNTAYSLSKTHDRTDRTGACLNPS